jgi:hypothetical protein
MIHSLSPNGLDTPPEKSYNRSTIKLGVRIGPEWAASKEQKYMEKSLMGVTM